MNIEHLDLMWSFVNVLRAWLLADINSIYNLQSRWEDGLSYDLVMFGRFTSTT